MELILNYIIKKILFFLPTELEHACSVQLIFLYIYTYIN